MTDKQKALSLYRVSQAEETIKSAQLCIDNHLFKDAINRSYYAAFYAVKRFWLYQIQILNVIKMLWHILTRNMLQQEFSLERLEDSCSSSEKKRDK